MTASTNHVLFVTDRVSEGSGEPSARTTRVSGALSLTHRERDGALLVLLEPPEVRRPELGDLAAPAHTRPQCPVPDVDTRDLHVAAPAQHGRRRRGSRAPSRPSHPRRAW